MQLTGRTLALAAAACVIGGAAFGVVTSIATAEQGQGQAAPTSPASSDLGDEVVSFPVPSSSAAPTSSGPSLAPTPDPTAAQAAALVNPAPTVTVTVTATPSDPNSSTLRPPVPASPKPRPTRAAVARAPEAKPDVVRETKPRNGWRPPTLQVGNNDITAPRLTSGADVGTFVACGPSTACTVSGNVLFISPEATSVTVTWNADSAHGYPHWWASTDLSR